ncbi:MAG: protein-L-isoaspartate O-methyltransferase [Bdellovibrionales bacterium]|nr:protein-L-isoaspartate O-methyltransferase [Bdellovibrionales bacterium]
MALARLAFSGSDFEFAKSIVEPLPGGDASFRMSVLEAFASVSRADFVSSDFLTICYHDIPIPIGAGKRTSKPSAVATMLLAAGPVAGQRVLEVGSGCGYVLAILSRLGAVVTGVEKVPSLAKAAKGRMRRLGFEDVTVLCGDGLAEPADGFFDLILVSGAVGDIPETLLDRLHPGGRLLLPLAVDGRSLIVEFPQRLMRVELPEAGSTTESEVADCGASCFAALE